MLTSIKKLLLNSADISFDQYYTQYLMDVQDSNLVSEIQNNIKKCSSSIEIEKLVQIQHGRLVE